MITLERLDQILAATGSMRIGLLGDLFLDRYLDIPPGATEYSIETGLEAHQVAGVRNSPGALGTVMANLAALGAGCLVPVTVLGDDGHAVDLLKTLASMPVDLRAVVRDADRLTPTYTKPLQQSESGPPTELNRLDICSRCPIADATQSRVLERLNDVFLQTDGLIVMDQIEQDDWGVVGRRARQRLAELAEARPEKMIFVDSRVRLSQFTCGTHKGNQSEILVAAGFEPADLDRTQQAALRSAHRTGRTCFCTMGRHGTMVASPEGNVDVAPAFPVTGPVDIVGAGDSATAGMVIALLAGADPVEAAQVGNLVASITVQQIGTTGTASPEQVRKRRRDV